MKATPTPSPVSATTFDQRMDKLESMFNKFAEQIQQLTTRVTTLETSKMLTPETIFNVDMHFASPTEFTNRYNKRTRFDNNSLASSSSPPSNTTVTSEILIDVGNSPSSPSISTVGPSNPELQQKDQNT